MDKVEFIRNVKDIRMKFFKLALKNLFEISTYYNPNFKAEVQADAKKLLADIRWYSKNVPTQIDGETIRTLNNLFLECKADYDNIVNGQDTSSAVKSALKHWADKDRNRKEEAEWWIDNGKGIDVKDTGIIVEW